MEPGTFGFALEALKGGFKVQRTGWNDKYMWLDIQHPDPMSKMSMSYIYMSTMKDMVVPWSPNQIDMLAEDWKKVT